jgi:peptidoglycan/LPS O-acetylase OafA/YrhL
MTLNSSFIRKKLLINDKRVQIDIFRGLAITQVIFFHSIIGFSSLSQRNDQNILSITVSLGEYFKFGPFIFFVISGFLMSTLYGSNLLRFEPENRKIIVKVYYVKRFARIYPLWIIFLILSYISFKLFNYGYFSLTVNLSNNANEFLLLALGATFIYYFISGIAAGWLVPGGWSIVSELIFYVTFPILRKMTINSLLFSSTLLITVFYILKYLIYQNFLVVEKTGFIWAIIYSGLETTIPFFLLGIVISELVNNPMKFPAVFNDKIFLLNISLMLFCLILVDNISGQNSKTILMIITTFILGCLISKTRYASKFISLMGTKSYFIYFVHFYLIDFFVFSLDQFESIFLNGFLTNTILILLFQIMVIGVSLALALFSSKFVERPLQNIIINKFVNYNNIS